ncbi:hypothetical protein ACIBL3_42765 [Kribbella sp. NPDC050124]|uniref:hypothetical protein n=1 Tax=Kribbella sp. NPDC050124 TaxID=3364114 RepID=UPI00378EB997
MTGLDLPAESSTTSVVAALSVVVAMAGHVLAGGGPVPLGVVPPLLALMGVCWLLGEYLAGERLLSALVLSGVQLFVHVTLDASHSGHMHRGISGSLFMTATHLAALMVGVLAVSQAHRWVHRVVRIFARLLPRLPALVTVRRSAAVASVVLTAPRLMQRWLTANVSRRGPPVTRVILLPS